MSPHARSVPTGAEGRESSQIDSRKHVMQTEFAFHGGVRDMALVAGYLLPTHWHCNRLLRSLPPVIVPNGIPAVPVSGFNAKIPMTENCANFAFPLFGTGKLREFCFPAISGRENCASFGVPKYPRSKTVSEIVRRQCLKRFRRHSSSFSFHN